MDLSEVSDQIYQINGLSTFISNLLKTKWQHSDIQKNFISLPIGGYFKRKAILLSDKARPTSI